MLLAQICQSWRSVALDTPALWSSLALEFRFDEESYSGLALFGDLTALPKDKIYAIPELWFTRAGAQPLTLSTTCMGRDTRLPAAAHALLSEYSALSIWR
jgi:hypothetical protein